MEAEPLLALAIAVASERSQQGVLDGIVKGLAAQPDVALARIWLLLPGDICNSCYLRDECRDRTKCFHLAASAGNPHNSPGEDWSFLNGHFRRMPLNVRKIGQVGATGAPLLIQDITRENECIAQPDWARREGIESFAGHPFTFRGQVLGVLGVFSRRLLDERAFSWLGMFADQAAVAIANARAFDELERAQVALRESAIRNRAVLETSLDCIITADHQGRIIEFSQAAERTFGYSSAEVMGKELAETIVPPGLREQHNRGMAQVIETGESRVLGKRLEMTAMRADGSEFPVELTITRVALEGPPIFTGFIRDITERKRAEEEVIRLRRQLELENAYLNEEVKERLAFGEIVGRSGALQKVLQQVQMVAPTDAAVLISGESGTGKELVARAIHDQSPRRARTLVTVNCASVPRDLFESEFFGHVKGAFTGAMRDRTGRFQVADKGTIFLDEVGEIPLESQSKLLRVLQEGQVRRVGDDREQAVDVRVIAASNRDLRQETEAGRFRRDLYYRLCVFPIHLPPLRERREDIHLLAAHFLGRAARRLNHPGVRLTDDGLEFLAAYDWPGNIRELHHVIERAVILSQGGELRIDLVLGDTVPSTTHEEAHFEAPLGLPGILSEQELTRRERENVLAALEKSRWKISGPRGAAASLGVKPTTLASRLKRLGIERPQ